MTFFTYNGISSADFGLHIESKNIFSAPEYDVSFQSIPGRSGDLIVSNNRFANVKVTYTVFVRRNTVENLSDLLRAVKGWLYTEPDRYHEIIPTPGGKEKWSISTVRSILSNEKYKGDALLQKSYTVDFLTKKTKVNEGEIPQYYVEDNHEAIISPEIFAMVQREMTKRGRGKKYHSSVHAFSSKIRCGHCGSWYGSKVWHSNSQYRKTIWQCNHKFDGDKHCDTPHLCDEDIQRLFLSAANKLLVDKAEVITNCCEMMDLLFNTTKLDAEQASLLEETQLISDMVQQTIYENAHVALDQTEYQKRYDILTQRFETAKQRLETVMAELDQMQTQRADIEAFLESFETLPDTLTEFKLENWHSLVDYATVYSTDDIRFTFKHGQEVQA